MLSSWTLRVRNADLTLGAVIDDWSGQLAEQCGVPSTLKVDGRTRDLAVLESEAGGVILDDSVRGRRFSGVLAGAGAQSDGTSSFTFESDLARLWDRDVYPTPGAVFTAQSSDYDIRTGSAENVILDFISANAGPSALDVRRIPLLSVPSSAGRGGTVTVKGRLDNLGRLVADIAEAASLRVDVVDTGGALAVVVYDMPDLSASATFGTARFGGPGLLGDWSYSFTKPDLNAALVGGTGDLAARVFAERADTDSQALWGRRIEDVVDSATTDVIADLNKAGDDALASGAQPVQISAQVLDSPALPLASVPLGALVTLNLDGRVVVDRLRTVTTDYSATSGQPTFSISGVVGSPDAGLTRSQKDFLSMRKSLRKVVAR